MIKFRDIAYVVAINIITVISMYILGANILI